METYDKDCEAQKLFISEVDIKVVVEVVEVHARFGSLGGAECHRSNYSVPQFRR